MNNRYYRKLCAINSRKLQSYIGRLSHYRLKGNLCKSFFDVIKGVLLAGNQIDQFSTIDSGSFFKRPKIFKFKGTNE